MKLVEIHAAVTDCNILTVMVPKAPINNINIALSE